MKTPPLCKTTACGRRILKKTGGRGLCNSCYLMARRLVKDGETSWDELEMLGVADPPVRRSTPKQKHPLYNRLMQIKGKRGSAGKKGD